MSEAGRGDAMTGTGAAWVDDEYADLYREHNARLVAYARSLTGNQAVAEDLAAEAHFRVWRRIRAGHAIDNPSAYLTTTVRNLAAGLGRAQREVARDVADLPEDPERAAIVAADPEQRASHVDLISRLLKELPERWAKALWYAEVEDLPMEAVGERIGASAGTTAVVLTRARERLRQAFLQSQPGMPANEECEQYWKRIPTIVRATASARRTKIVLEHCEGCEDCRTRMLALTEANTRLPLLLGPALFGIVLGGGTWLLPAVAGAGAGTAAGAGTSAGAAGKAGAAARVGSRLARHGLSPAKATVYGGAVAAVGIAAVAAAIALGSTPPSHPTAAVQPQATTHPTAAAKQPAAASAPTSAASAAASAPSTTAPTLTASAAHDAVNPAQQTSASGTNSATTTIPTAASTTPAAPTSSTATTPLAGSSTSATSSVVPTFAATLAPTLTPSPPASPPPSSPTQSPTTEPTRSGPTSGPTPPPSCDVEIFGVCIIW
jgi:RNA polymerase sigma factor (sigma-70 family)